MKIRGLLEVLGTHALWTLAVMFFVGYYIGYKVLVTWFWYILGISAVFSAMYFLFNDEND